MRRSSIGVSLMAAVMLLTVSACGGGSDSTATTGDTSTTTAASSDGAAKVSGASLQEIIKRKKNAECTYSLATANMTGTAYIADGKLFATYKASFGGQPEVTGHVLNDGTYTYSWNESSATGTKFKNSVAESLTTTTKAGQTTTTNSLAQQFDFDCSKWSPDNSLFSAPSNVTFTDSTATLTNAPSAEDIKKQVCASSEMKSTPYCAGVS